MALLQFVLVILIFLLDAAACYWFNISITFLCFSGLRGEQQVEPTLPDVRG